MSPGLGQLASQQSLQPDLGGRRQPDDELDRVLDPGSHRTNDPDSTQSDVRSASSSVSRFGPGRLSVYGGSVGNQK